MRGKKEYPLMADIPYHQRGGSVENAAPASKRRGIAQIRRKRGANQEGRSGGGGT